MKGGKSTEFEYMLKYQDKYMLKKCRTVLYFNLWKNCSAYKLLMGNCNVKEMKLINRKISSVIITFIILKIDDLFFLLNISIYWHTTIILLQNTNLNMKLISLNIYLFLVSTFRYSSTSICVYTKFWKVKTCVIYETIMRLRTMCWNFSPWFWW